MSRRTYGALALILLAGCMHTGRPLGPPRWDDEAEELLVTMTVESQNIDVRGLDIYCDASPRVRVRGVFPGRTITQRFSVARCPVLRFVVLNMELRPSHASDTFQAPPEGGTLDIYLTSRIEETWWRVRG